MLEVGTKVYIKKLFREDRPELPEHSADYEQDAGYIVQDLGNNYYLVKNLIDNTIMCVAHKDELIDMTTYKRQYKLGDEVRIHQASEEEKEAFSDIINIGNYEDLSVRYTGRVVRIDYVMNCYPDVYMLEGLPGVWHIMNLEPPHEFVGY